MLESEPEPECVFKQNDSLLNTYQNRQKPLTLCKALFNSHMLCSRLWTGLRAPPPNFVSRRFRIEWIVKVFILFANNGYVFLSTALSLSLSRPPTPISTLPSAAPLPIHSTARTTLSHCPPIHTHNIFVKTRTILQMKIYYNPFSAKNK